ncbi:flagellar hook-associated protein 2 [Cytobacillus sp. S13-E01]|uniref:flagellar hook-associated protein 2 n=1 Tax=Cytobacillus sp. S13-E01 TaxID=3031326 RepID=UPI0023D823DF|nr:flagellar hook-associated protein 2 [Cytobacillus sp. S13-E01]MDF0726082.1 flagellar hook-associated protein 2 [Cytobacillus sp. S13-E01]
MGMRISGLASGMDIDTIVKDLMKVERMKVDKLSQKKQIIEWQRDLYRELNTELQNFDTFLRDGVGMSKTFNAKIVTSSDSTKVTAVSSGSTTNISTRVEVGNLATATTWQSDSSINYAYTGADITTTTWDFASKTIGTDLTLSYQVTDPGGEVRNSVTVDLKKGDTIDSVISKINSSNLGVSAMKESILVDGTVDPPTYEERVVFSNKLTGSGASIVSNDETTTDFMQSLGFSGAATSGEIVTDLAYRNNGEDATVKIDGFQLQKASNTFTINNITYTLHNKTAIDEAITISSSTDTDAVFDSVIKFMDKYNELIDKVNGKLNEEVYRSYKPLTNEEREALSEKEIELWEEKAKSGILRNDSIFSKGINQLRQANFSRVDAPDIGIFTNLSEIGIVTSKNYRDGGKLVLDPNVTGTDRLTGEQRLRKAIETDPNAIYKLFMSGADEKETDRRGIARRMRDTIKSTIDDVVKKAGNQFRVNNQFTLGRELDDVDNRVSSYERRLIQVEDRYYRQFTAMEKAIQQANQQASYIMQQFGGGV